MKITISPSQDQTGQKFKFYAVSIEHPDDEADVSVALEMCVNALIAWGFQRDWIVNAMDNYTL